MHRPITSPLSRPLADAVTQGRGATIRNLLTKTQEFDDAAWTKTATTTAPTITADADTAPDGTATADRVNATDGFHAIRQQATVLPSTAYVFSFYAKRGTMTNLKYSVHNASAGADIVAATTYYALTNSSTHARITVAFTTPANCTSVYVYPSRDPASTGNFYVWGAQLERGTVATAYQRRP